jgi:integrase
MIRVTTNRMKTNPPTGSRRQQVLQHVATNLFRSDRTGIYYTIFKRKGRQVKRSLKTTNRELARRRLETQAHNFGKIRNDEKNIFFAELDSQGHLTGGLAKRWFDTVKITVEPSTSDRYLENLRQLARFFRGMAARKIDLDTVEAWAQARSPQCEASTFNKERDVLSRVFVHGIKHGILLDNPAALIERRRPHKKVPEIPTHEKFRQMLAVMRDNGGGRSADLTEVCAESGCRVSEIVGNKKYKKEPMRWRDIDFDRRTFTVRKSKNHRGRVVPLFRRLESCLRRLHAQSPTSPKPEDRIIPICSAKKSIETACRKLGLPQYGHHTCRHIFCSNAIEKLVDFKTIAEWLGHLDGGALVAKTYGHLRNEHADQMARRMDLDGTESEQPTNIVPIEAGYRRTQHD